METEFKRDMGVVDLELKRQTSILKEQLAKLENKLTKSVQQNSELKNLLQMAVKSDTRKDALLEEVKIQFENERKKIADKINLIETEKNSIDGFKKDIKSENLALIEKLNALEYQNKELTSKSRQIQSFLTEKE